MVKIAIIVEVIYRTSLRALSITKCKRWVTRKTVSCKSIISLAEDINRCTSISNQEKSIIAFYALTIIIIGITVLNLILSVYFRDLTNSIENRVPWITSCTAKRRKVKRSTLSINSKAWSIAKITSLTTLRTFTLRIILRATRLCSRNWTASLI